MKPITAIISICLFLAGCAVENAMPLGNDMMQIDVTAAPRGANKAVDARKLLSKQKGASFEASSKPAN